MALLQQRKRLQSEASRGTAEVPRGAPQDGDPGTKDGGCKIKFSSRTAVKIVLVFHLAPKENVKKMQIFRPWCRPQVNHNDRSQGKCAGMLNELSSSRLFVHLWRHWQWAEPGIGMVFVSNRSAQIMTHGNILNPFVRPAQKCPCCLLLLTGRNQRFCGHILKRSPTWPEAPQWHDEISQARFCCGLCDSRDEILTRGSGRLMPNLMPTTFAWLMTHNSSLQKRSFSHQNALQISTLSLI